MSNSPFLAQRLDPSASPYLSAMKERVLFFDGALGTNLQLLDLTPDDFGGEHLAGCNEYLVATRPDVITTLHEQFLGVGCDVIETDTFGSFSLVLAEYGLEAQASSLTRTATDLARAAADKFSTSTKPRFVAG